MNKHKGIQVLLCILVFLMIFYTLNKNSDYHEITQTSFVNSMGIDYNHENQTYDIYLYILNNFNLGRNPTSIDSKTLAYVCHGQGSTIQEAIANITSNTNIFIQLTHLKTLILKDTFFQKNNLIELYHFVKSNPLIFPTFEIFTTSDDIFKIYQIEHFSETSPYYSLLVNSKGTTSSKRPLFIDFINNFLKPNYCIRYPIIKVSSSTFYNQDKSYDSIYIDGYSFITSDYHLSSFRYDNLAGLKFFNELSGNIINLKDFDYQVNSYQMKVYYQNKVVIGLKFEGFFLNNNLMYTHNELIEKFKAEVINDLNETKKVMDNYLIDAFMIDYYTQGKVKFYDCEINYIFDIS